MTPSFELAVTEENPNSSVLSRRFPQLELEGGNLLINNPNYTPTNFTDGYVTILNDEKEQLIMLPKEERWFLYKEQGLEEGPLSFFGLTLTPEVDEESNLAFNIESLASSKGMKIVLLKDRNPLSFDYLYGEVLSRNPFEEQGQYLYGSNYYSTEEEYGKDLRKIEAMTGLKIKVFNIRVTSSPIYKLELLMELE